MKHAIPEAATTQHIAVLGKTGSGKTSTAKLIVEQVLTGGARVCVLDPIKSDWWGLVLRPDGITPALPFQILGGPHGHVPLHAAAGKAVAEVVASGALPLSIIDMADFAPGGQAHFFTDFAPALLRKMRGVLYVVMEEAHLFAPKERSGIGKENMAIHWAKTLAQAGRSKGVRLILLTQRTQALHNAMLGACDTLIAHRLTSPADQEPVIKWLKANTTKQIVEEVAASLSKLKTGEGWLCSGEAQIFERRKFPRITTYDNTATPTDDEHREVTVPPVDVEALKALIGEAVKEAEASDPKKLREEVAKLRAQLAARSAGVPQPPRLPPARLMPPPRIVPPIPKEPDLKENEVDRATAERLERENAELRAQLARLQPAPRDYALQRPPAVSRPPADDEEESMYQRFKARLLSEVPIGGGTQFVVTPPEKLRKDFQEAEAERIVEAVSGLNQLGKRTLKLLEALGKAVTLKDINLRLGRSEKSTSDIMPVIKGMAELGIVKSENKWIQSTLRKKITDDLSAYQPAEAEVEAVYQSVLYQIATDAGE